MPQINKAIPLHQPQSSKSPIHVKQIVQISEDPDKLFKNPIAIGTKGTIGSLIMQEIDYFTRLELSGRDRCCKPPLKLEKSASLRDFSRLSKLEKVISIPVIKRKGGGSNRLIPSMCSTIEVAEQSNKMMSTYSRFSYRNLKSDVKKVSTVANAVGKFRESELF